MPEPDDRGAKIPTPKIGLPPDPHATEDEKKDDVEGHSKIPTPKIGLPPDPHANDDDVEGHAQIPTPKIGLPPDPH